MDNNKGFTLIELLVSIAILGILLAAVFGFMLSGTRSYSNINGKVDLQTDSHLTMNFLEEYLIDCNEAIYPNGNSIYILNSDKAYAFKYDSSNSIYFLQGSASIQSDGSFKFVKDPTIEPALLSDMIHTFTVKRTLSGTGDNQYVVSVELQVSFRNYSSEVNSSKIIALRNKPAYKIVFE